LPAKPIQSHFKSQIKYSVFTPISNLFFGELRNYFEQPIVTDTSETQFKCNFFKFLNPFLFIGIGAKNSTTCEFDISRFSLNAAKIAKKLSAFEVN